MAFCVKCGAQLEEGAKFCTACAFPVDGSVPANTQIPTATPVPVSTKPMNKKRLGIMIGVVAALVLVIVLVAVLFFGGGADHSSPEAVTETCIEAYNSGDADTFLDCYPDFFWEYTADRMGRDVSAVKDLMEQTVSGAPWSGRGIKIKKVKVEEETDDFDKIPAYLRECMSHEVEKAFESWAEVEIKIEIDGDDFTKTMYCICLNGKWYAMKFL